MTLYEQLLARIPDTEDTRQLVFMNDYARFREILGIQPPDGGGEQELEEYVAKLVGGKPAAGLLSLGPAPFISGLDEYAFEATQRGQYLGFDARNVDQTVLAGNSPMTLEVVRGRFSPSASEKAIAACKQCLEPSRQQHRGVAYYEWGEDFEAQLDKRWAPPAFDSLGRGGRIAVQEQFVLRTLGTEAMIRLIEAGQGQKRSLAEVEEYRILAQAMSGMGSYAVIMTDQTEMLPPDVFRLPQKGEPKQPTNEARLLKPYLVLASGAGKDAKGGYVALALVHADANTAVQNAELLRGRVGAVTSATGRPWREMVESAEVNGEGRLVTAKLRTGDRGLWLELVYQLDPLLMHE